MFKILSFRILLIKLRTFLTPYTPSTKISEVILDIQSLITETEDPLGPVESTQFVPTACTVTNRNTSYCQSATLQVSEVISKAIRDAPGPRANSKPLNSKENGGQILNSRKLKTAVLQLSSLISIYYHSAVIFLHQSLLLQMDNTTACNNMECMHSFDHCEINHLSLLCYLQMSTQMSDISKQYFIQLRQALRPSLMFDKKQGEHPPWEIFATQKDLDFT